MHRVRFTSFFMLGAVWSLGCAPELPPPAPAANITGTITLDSKPIPTGEIHFGTPGVPPSVLQITNGTFAGAAPVGNNKVEVYIYVEGPKSEKYGGSPTKTNVAPEKYWGAQTTLEANVKAGGTDEFKFELTSK